MIHADGISFVCFASTDLVEIGRGNTTSAAKNHARIKKKENMKSLTIHLSDGTN